MLVVAFASVAIIAEINSGLFAPPPIPIQIYQPNPPEPTEKVVSIIFDDGWKSQLDAIPVLEQYNFSVAFAIVASYPDYPDFMNWKEIAFIAQKGHDIASHTLTHPRLSTLDNETLHTELSKSQQILRSKGYPANILVYPYGDGNDNQTVRDAVAKYYLLARGTEIGKYNLTSPDRFTITSYGIYNYTTMTDFADYLDGTQGNNVTLLYYHKISPENIDMAIPIETFQAQMQYLKDNGYTVKTISELFLKTLPPE